MYELVGKAIASRFYAVKPYLVQKYDDGTEMGYCYDDARCLPENLVQKFTQIAGNILPSITQIIEGYWDAEIEATWHLAAGVAAWYRRGKDWGTDEVPDEIHRREGE